MKHPFIAFVVNFMPGLGHIYLNRVVRGLAYMFFSLGPAIAGLGLSFLVNSGEPFFAGAIFGFIVYFISFIDLIVTLATGSYKAKAVPASHPSGEAGAVNHGNAEHLNSHAGSDFDGSTERFYAILLSFIPGLGHFQIGLMNRGLNFLMLFFGTLTLIAFITLVTGERGFLVFLGVLPVIWLYNLFDAMRLVHRKQNGEPVKDDTLLEDWDKHREGGRKSTVIATFLALVPGAGHMYLGLQRRGLQLMAGFLFSIYILDALHLSLFLFIIPLIWFFSFFDVLQWISRYAKGEEMKDEPIVGWLLNHQRWIGAGLIALGGFYLTDRVLIRALDHLMDTKLALWFDRHFQTTFVSILLIGIGIWLLRKSGREGRKQ